MSTRYDAFQEGFNRRVFPALSRFMREMECEPDTPEEQRRFKEMTSDSLAYVRQQVLRYADSVRIHRILEMQERFSGSNIIPFPSRGRQSRWTA